MNVVVNDASTSGTGAMIAGPANGFAPSAARQRQHV
jgi:hypothetical protein